VIASLILEMFCNSNIVNSIEDSKRLNMILPGEDLLHGRELALNLSSI